jgi:VIT1/CCC1 family predicted Fe2+/Mn2+ transporter
MGASNYLSRRSYAEAEDRADRPEAAKHGAATTAAFVVAGTLPLLAYLVPVPSDREYAVAIALTGAALFAVGAARSSVTKLGWLRSGLEMLVVGAGAAAVAYAIGAFAAGIT